MKPNWQHLALLFILLFTTLFTNAQNIAPIEYIKNNGQWDGPFEYKGITPRGDFYIRKNGFTIVLADDLNHDLIHKKHHGQIKEDVVLKYHAYEMNFLGANEMPDITASKLQSHYYNYFLGNDTSRWKTEIHPAQNVDYKNLYTKIDAHIYSENNNIKYDYILHNGADINNIKVQYKGVDKIAIKKGNLEIKTSLGANIEEKPIAYQFINDEKVMVNCEYVLNNNIVSYKIIGNYNPNIDLIIDPAIVFCSFTGSTGDNFGFTATYGPNGEFYDAGINLASGYPVTTGAYQTTWAGGNTASCGNACDISVSKFNATGTAMLFATYLGGSSNEQPHSLVTDKNGNLYLAGRSFSTNYPIKPGCYQSTNAGDDDIIVTVLNSTGTALIGSTYIGGSGTDGVNGYALEVTLGDIKHDYGDDARSEIIIDTSNFNIYIAGSTMSSNFPTTNIPTGSQSSFGGVQDGVLIKLNQTCSSLLSSSFIGGSGKDAAYVLTLNKQNPNELFIAGGTASSNFPITAGSLQTTYGGGTFDGWLRKYNMATNTLVASTYIGTAAYDQVFGVQTDDSNNVYIMGQSQGPYPVVGTVYSNPNSPQFVTKINNTLTTKLLSTVFGNGSVSTTNISPNAFLVDKCNNVYISGWGGSLGLGSPGSTTGLPVTANAIKGTTDGDDFYFIVFGPNLSSLLYGSFFGLNNTAAGEHVDGGTSRFDPQGVIYQAICAACGNASGFPTTPGVYGPNNLSNNCNLAALKIDFQILGAKANAIASPNTTGCLPFLVNFANNSTNATNYLWIFGDGTPNVTTTSPSHTFNTPGTFTVNLVAFNANGCAGTTDTTKLIIVVKNDSIHNNFNIVKIDSCNPFTIQINNTSTETPSGFGSGTTFNWDFGDGNTSTLQNPGNHSYATTGSYNVTLTITNANACNSPTVVTKTVNFLNNVISANFTIPAKACPPFTNTFTNVAVGATSYSWNFGDGSTSTSASPSHTYTIPGTYTVTFIIANPASCNKFDSVKQVINILPKITAAFTTLKTDTCNPYIVAINNTSILNNLYPTAGLWTKYLWDFGDGTTSTLSNPATHTYSTFGSYTIKLILTDTTACNSPQTFTQSISFIDNNIHTTFNLPDTACIPFVNTFNNTTTNPGTYSWNFGTGATSILPTPTYTFTTLGTFTVTLNVQNPATCNKQETKQHVITIVPTPTANFYYLPNPPLPNKVVNFNNQSTGAISYLWDFGDGKTSTLENPSHLYQKAANLKVCLTAFNAYGCPDSVCRDIHPDVVNIIDVPTAFSPNGDGVNDFIQVRGYGVKDMVFKIYNRFGELVYSSTNIDEKWDGKYKGVVQEMDAFAYLLNVTFTDNSTTSKQGSITLIK